MCILMFSVLPAGMRNIETEIIENGLFIISSTIAFPRVNLRLSLPLTNLENDNYFG